jgi:hypothetical protein
MSDDWHVYPQRDLIEHEVNGENCPCVPTVEPIEREDGSFGWLHLHHSFDGREQHEETK